jgi:hypothetical protein
VVASGGIADRLHAARRLSDFYACVRDAEVQGAARRDPPVGRGRRPVPPAPRADRRRQHDRAQARGVIARRLVEVGAEPAGDQRPVAKGELSADVKQAAVLDDGHIGGDRRGGLGQGEAEVGEFGG